MLLPCPATQLQAMQLSSVHAHQVHEGALRPRVSVALTFPESSPGPLGLRKRSLSAPGALDPSLPFPGKSSFLSLWATIRDREQPFNCPRPQPVPPSQDALSCSHTVVGSTWALGREGMLTQDLTEGARPQEPRKAPAASSPTS